MSVGHRSQVRTCVGCRGRSAKTCLLRIVATGEGLVPDFRGRLPGRGAYLHPDLSCLDLAERRRSFPRALRQPGPLDTTRVRRQLETAPRGASKEGEHRVEDSSSQR